MVDETENLSNLDDSKVEMVGNDRLEIGNKAVLNDCEQAIHNPTSA